VTELKWGQEQGEVLAPAPEVKTSALAKMDKLTPEEIFIPGTMDPILTAIKDEVDKQAAGLKDMTVKANRDALRSLAMRVVKSRTFVEGQRKGLVAARKKALADIDSEARRISAILEGIEDDARAPLTAWEQVDKDRKAKHESVMAELIEVSKHPAPFGATSQAILDRIAEVEAIDPTKAEEFADLTASHQKAALKALGEVLWVVQQQEAQKAENARLQAEANERAIKEGREQAARDARNAALAESAQREKDAEERAALAEKRRVADQAEAVRKAEEAAQQAERDREAAIEAERKRVAKVAEDARLAAEAREKNKKHKAAIETAAIDNLLDISGMTADLAGAVVEAIAAGLIEHVTISY
jgi:hypothetical protein